MLHNTDQGRRVVVSTRNITAPRKKISAVNDFSHASSFAFQSGTAYARWKINDTVPQYPVNTLFLQYTDYPILTNLFTYGAERFRG